jgi:hypothetical protein
MTEPPVESTAVGPDPIEPYARWARVLFAIMAIVTVIGLVLAVVGAGMAREIVPTVGPLDFFLLAFGSVLGLVVLLLLLRGIATRDAWALHAIAPVCYLLLVLGLIRVIVALTQSQILFPLEAIGAALVLTRPHGSALLPAATDDDRRRVWLVVAAFVVTYALPIVSTLLSR